MNNNTDDFTPKTDPVPIEETPIPEEIPENTPGLFEDDALKLDTTDAKTTLQNSKRASKKLVRPLAVIGVAVVLMIALIVVLMFTVFKRTTPLDATFNSFSEVFKGSKVSEVLKKLDSDGGKLEFSMGEDGAGISGSVIVNSKRNYLFDIDYSADGSTSPINVQGYVTNEELAAMSESFTEGDWYGFELKDIKKQLEDSIFDPDSGSEYAFDKEAFDVIVEALESFRNSGEYDKALQRALDNINKEWTVYLKDNVTVKDDEVRFRGKKIKVTKTTYELDEDDLVGLVEILDNEYHKNEEFRNCLDSYPMIYGNTTTVNGFDFDDVLDELIAQLKRINADVTIEFYLKGNTLVKLGCETTLSDNSDSSYTVVFDITFGDKPSFETGFDLSLQTVENGYVESDINISMRTEEDTDEEYTVALTVDYVGVNETGSARIALECDRENGDFKFSVVVDGKTFFEADGEYKYEKGKLLEIELDRINQYEDSSDGAMVLNLKLKITLGKQPLDKPDYEDIFEMKDGELEDLIKKIGEAIGEFDVPFSSDAYEYIPDDVTYGTIVPGIYMPDDIVTGTLVPGE